MIAKAWTKLCYTSINQVKQTMIKCHINVGDYGAGQLFQRGSIPSGSFVKWVGCLFTYLKDEKGTPFLNKNTNSFTLQIFKTCIFICIKNEIR